VSRYFRSLGRDNNFWKSRCLDESSFLELLRTRRSVLGNGSNPADDVGLSNGEDANDAFLAPDSPPRAPEFRASREKTRVMANWDPSFPSEHVSWYDEYIHRRGPVSINWLQLPTVEASFEPDYIEARGLALYYPDNAFREGNRPETALAVSPLDDGSVCLWDVNGTRGKQGAIVAKSRPGILFIDGPGADNTRRSKRVDSGVTECVTVDSYRHKAFFAVQSRECPGRVPN
jgi:hypothetical protein